MAGKDRISLRVSVEVTYIDGKSMAFYGTTFVPLEELRKANVLREELKALMDTAFEDAKRRGL